MDCRGRFNYESASKKDRLIMAQKILTMAYILSILIVLELTSLVIYIKLNNILNHAIVISVAAFTMFQMLIVMFLITMARKIKTLKNPEANSSNV